MNKINKILDYNEMKNVFNTLNKNFYIYAPKKFIGKGRYSDTDLISYAKIEDFSEIEWYEKSYYSPKEILFPITTTTYYFINNNIFENKNTPLKDILIFLRPCNINGIERLDNIFLKNSPYIDPYYENLRKKIKFILIECKEGYQNCFCVAMNSNKTDNYSLAIGIREKKFYC